MFKHTLLVNYMNYVATNTYSPIERFVLVKVVVAHRIIDNMETSLLRDATHIHTHSHLEVISNHKIWEVEENQRSWSVAVDLKSIQETLGMNKKHALTWSTSPETAWAYLTFHLYLKASQYVTYLR